MLQVSIIIPIFKVEEYIVECIESVLSQSYLYLEIILVDDCSPDNSMDLAKKCIEESSNSKIFKFKYLKHDKNRGLSAARNTGIKASTGDYLYFLDSDDAITEDCISTLVENSNGGKTDMVCGAFQVIGNENSLWHQYQFNDRYFSENHEIVKYYTSGALYVMAWNKLISRNLVLDRKLYFLEGVIHEDNHWSFLVSNQIQSLKTLTHKGYRYYHREGGITGHLSVRKRYDSFITILEAFNAALVAGVILKYPECIKFIEKSKVQWIRELCKSKEFSFVEKFKYFKRVLELQNHFSFLLHYIFNIIKEWFYCCLEKGVMLRTKLYNKYCNR